MVAASVAHLLKRYLRLKLKIGKVPKKEKFTDVEIQYLRPPHPNFYVLDCQDR